MPGQKQIVLLHGWGAKTEKLVPLANELEKLGWRVFIPKLPGFELPPPGQIWGSKEYGRYVLKEAQKVYGEKKFFLFGHSFGGRIAIRLGAANHQSLAGLILCAPSGLSRSHPLKRFAFWIFAKTGKVLLLLLPAAKIFRPLLYKLAREHDYEKSKGMMKKVFKKVVAEDLRPKAKKIRAPVLVLWGKQDRLTPLADSYYLKSVLPRAKLAIFKRQGHQLPYQQPQAIAKKINQWTRRLI